MLDGPRYAFHPLERRGVLLGLDAGQLLTIGAGAVLAVAAHTVLGDAVGIFVGFAIITAGLAAALWTRGGTSIGTRAVTAFGWVLRRSSQPLLDDSPTVGRVVSAGQGDTVRPGTLGAKTAPPGIQVIEDQGLPGEAVLGVVRDQRSGTWAAVVPVRGCSFSLLDPLEQAHLLDGWRRVLGSVARAGSPVVRVQWVQRSWSGGSLSSESAAQSIIHHQAWVVLVVRPSPHQLHASGGRRQAVTELRRELRLLGGQLREAALEPLEPLDLTELGHLIAGPGASPAGTAGTAWPLAADDGWSAYRADGGWHATYWIAEWPRVQVGPDFLTPLLVGSGRTTVSVVMAPVPPDRAMREVRSARTADLADAQLRARAGFLQSARRERESEGVTRREAELADGHHEFRFTGYVTVSADDPAELTAACAAAEHAAGSARLELRRLYGRQAEAFTWTLPLGRGLR